MLYIQKNQQKLEDEIDKLKGKDMSPKEYYQLRINRIMKRREQEILKIFMSVPVIVFFAGAALWIIGESITVLSFFLLFWCAVFIGIAIWLYSRNFPEDAFIAKAKRRIAAEYRALHQTE